MSESVTYVKRTKRSEFRAVIGKGCKQSCAVRRGRANSYPTMRAYSSIDDYASAILNS